MYMYVYVCVRICVLFLFGIFKTYTYICIYGAPHGV